MSDKLFKKFAPKTNSIYRGDNLEIMRAMPDNWVDLCYIDPPFFTQRNYKNIWGDRESVLDWEKSKLEGFFDTRDFFEKHVHNGEKGLAAYLVWMRARLVEIHRMLKPSGSLFVHLDYHAVHYVKVMLDEIFGYKKFRTEIIWQRKQGGNSTSSEPRTISNNSDTILYYTKSDEFKFEAQYQDYTEEFIEKSFTFTDEKGERYASRDMRSPSPRPNLRYDYKGYKPHRNGWAVSLEKMKELDRNGELIFPKNKSGRIRKKHYLKDAKGVAISNIWDDIGCLQGNSLEKTGWPTQKPVSLLERIVKMASEEGDMIFDCFAGCGTTLHAAHRLKRKWVGIDMSPTAMKVNKKRLEEINAKVAIIDESELEQVTKNQVKKAS